MSVEREDCLVSKEYYNVVERDDDGGAVRSRATLGYAALDIARNYCGADPSAGSEVVAASQLGGRVCVWFRLDPLLAEKGTTVADDAATITAGDGSGRAKYVQPHAEFTVNSATGTTLAIRPPTLGNYYSKKETDILVALGCANGAVVLCKTGLLAARPGGENAASSGAVVGDSASASVECITILSKSTPGEIVATIGGGHACVMSLAFHPTSPNSFATGRKDGTVDIYSSADDGGYLSFRRMHRLVHSSFPIRALAFSRPDGALLFAGDDDGKLYSYDASCNNEKTHMSAPVKLVACALTAHKGWVMNLIPFPDGRRVATCGSDRSVRVWDCGMGLASSTPVHSFEGAHDGLVWGVDCGSVVGASSGGIGGVRTVGDRVKLISCGNDGGMQIFSCGE